MRDHIATYKIRLDIERPLLISRHLSKDIIDIHVVVRLNRRIRIQYQSDPDDTFYMTLMGYIQLQYLTTSCESARTVIMMDSM